MPEKRKETERFTFYLSKPTAAALNNYVSTNYTMPDSYGAYSQTADAAISCFCANMNNSASCGSDPNLLSDTEVNKFLENFTENITKELGLEEEAAYESDMRGGEEYINDKEFKEVLDRVMEEHKETLDKLSDEEVKKEDV
jgi:hypothetical protein